VVTGDRPANIGKVVAEASSETGTIDALLVGGVELKSLLDAKALYGPLVGPIPDSDKLDGKLSKVQEGYATNGYLLPVYRNQTGFVYDPEKVPNPPQSWEDFTAWLDANPGQFAFNDPSKGGSGQAFVQAAIANLLGDEERYAGDTELDEKKVADWGKVWDWFNANQDKFTITASNNDSIDRVNQGEVMMAAAWDDDTKVSLDKGTLFKRAKLYIPALGMPGGGDSLGIPANAPHKAAALLWAAYLVEADVQKQMNATIGSYLARTDIAGENALIPEEQRQKNGRAWIPGAYKGYFIQEFVAQVLQK
jgi:putative spermidine/putrescine transport system substrate-binding protein